MKFRSPFPSTQHQERRLAERPTSSTRSGVSTPCMLVAMWLRLEMAAEFPFPPSLLKSAEGCGAACGERPTAGAQLPRTMRRGQGRRRPW